MEHALHSLRMREEFCEGSILLADVRGDPLTHENNDLFARDFLLQHPLRQSRQFDTELPVFGNLLIKFRVMMLAQKIFFIGEMLAGIVSQGIERVQERSKTVPLALPELKPVDTRYQLGVLFVYFGNAELGYLKR